MTRKVPFKIIGLLCFLLAMVIACSINTQPYNKSVHEVEFTAQDGQILYADWAPRNSSQKTILLFHQGGASGRGEYDSIMPVLYNLGYNILATDLRTGGELFEGVNRTVGASNKEFEYCDTHQDIEATIDFVKSKGYGDEIILWGSSFSGTIALNVASVDGQDILGVLAFSPASGGPMAACKPDEAIRKLEIPVFLARPSRELEIPSAQQQFELAKLNNHQTYVAENGTHGSSMLVESRVGADVSANWEAVKKFLISLD